MVDPPETVNLVKEYVPGGKVMVSPRPYDEKDSVEIGEAVVRFVPEGPQGRPQLHAELFV